MAQFDNSTPHLASAYDDKIHGMIPYYDNIHREVINLIKATNVNPRLWLDTGCGTGTFVRKALEVFTDTQFLLADPSESMLDVAREKLAGQKRVRFLEPVASQDLQFDQKIDVITAIQAHHYLTFEDRRKATRVCYDLLREQGVYVTFENTRPFSDKGITVSMENWSNFQRSAGRDDEMIKSHMNRFDTEYYPITIETHLKLLRDCGFKTVELLWFSYMQAGFYGIK